MAAGRRFLNTVIAISRPQFEISSPNLVGMYIWAVHYLGWRHISVKTTSKMAAAAMLKNQSNSVFQSLLHILTQYFARRLKSVSQNQKCIEMSLPIKYKMAVGRRVENTLIATIRPQFEISSPNLIRRYIWDIRCWRWGHISVGTTSKMAAASILKIRYNCRTSVATDSCFGWIWYFIASGIWT